ncbi:MAG: type II secretion system protein [Verrucomicrobiota bacterium]
MRPFSPNSSKACRSGLTFVELLVVLSIVAVLSTVALRSVIGTLEQQNYDSNLTQLEQIESAVVGDTAASGFVGDIGRLPIAIGADPLTQLQELWQQGVFPNYAINTPAGDAEVRLGTGWRGPYLDLGLTRTDVTDGFANSFIFYQSDGSAVAAGDTISIIQSLGLTGTVGGTGYEEDVETVFQADAAAATVGAVEAGDVGDFWREALVIHLRRDDGQVFETSDGQYLVIRAYGPLNGIAGTSVQEEIDVSTTMAVDYSNIDDGTGPGETLILSMSVPRGAKALRAYQAVTAVAPGSEDPLADSGTPTTYDRVSPIRHITVDDSTSGPITFTLSVP